MKQKPNLSLFIALIPVATLVLLLSLNVLIYGNEALNGSNQFILLMGGAVAAIVGFSKKTSYNEMLNNIEDNIKSVTGAILILLFVGALAGTWLISGIIPAMIYYGLQILHPTYFLAACIIICALISIATGSSWTTSATVGIALIGIGEAMGLSVGMVAGAVISGAYFGDKMSPLSDTTNLAPAMAGSDLFSHIRYMSITTIPTICITLLTFLAVGFMQDTSLVTQTEPMLIAINEKFNVSPILFIVPILVIVMIARKTPPIVALLIGTLLGAIFTIVFQQSLILNLNNQNESWTETYKLIMDAITVSTNIETSHPLLNKLFQSGGMSGMLGTIWLIVCAMVFGGIMDAIGALQAISAALLKLAKNSFQLFASTVASCLAINLTASDQYLSLVVPGKMFSKAYKERGLAPENLSRTLEDSGTVTSVLIPWNTCGAYQSGVLGVSVNDYFIYAIFNWLSPFTTLLFSAIGFKIKQLKS
jgi:NhaC family Na+:H+ antiporter